MIGMPLSSADLAELARLFIRVSDRAVIANVMITADTLPLSRIWGMARRGLLMFEEVPHFRRNFGVTAWDVLLRPLGRALLEPLRVKALG